MCLGGRHGVRAPARRVYGHALGIIIVRTTSTMSSMKKILIIEDDSDSSEMLSMLLEFQGHSVTCAALGRTGITAAKSAAPDVIITDLGLPDMDGLEVIRELMNSIGMLNCSIIALTGRNDPDTRRLAEEAGVNHFFAKGDDVSSLLALIDQQA